MGSLKIIRKIFVALFTNNNCFFSTQGLILGTKVASSHEMILLFNLSGYICDLYNRNNWLGGRMFIYLFPFELSPTFYFPNVECNDSVITVLV